MGYSPTHKDKGLPARKYGGIARGAPQDSPYEGAYVLGGDMIKGGTQ